MSGVYTSIICNKIISKIQNNSIASYDEVLAALEPLHGTFRKLGLADMCWNKKTINFNYSTTRMLVHKYNYRFQNDDFFWKTLSETQKEELALLMQTFESRTNILCGIQYDFYLGKHLTLKNTEFVSPFVYFLPEIVNQNPYIKMVNLSGDKVLFTDKKSDVLYRTKVENWKYDGIYSLNQLISAINDKRLIFNLDNEILVKSNYHERCLQKEISNAN